MMATTIAHQDRVFQLWAYTVSMGRLLLRSTKTDSHLTRVDVMFQNVQALQLPAILDGLDVSEAAADQVEKIIQATALLPDEGRTFYVVAGSNYEGYVVAGVVVSSEDEGEYFDETPLWPGSASV